MKRIDRKDACHYFFDRNIEAAIKVKPGESFILETEDAFSGKLKSIEDLAAFKKDPISTTSPSLSNPMAGPVYIEGAEKGDVLAVHIEKIEVDEVGRTFWWEKMGPLKESRKWPQLGAPFYQEIRHLPGPSGTRRDGKGVLTEGISWDLAPFIGTIGTAPEVEVLTSAVGQGPWGGNLDCRDIKEGTTVLLPVYNDGALLFAGDVHGGQGDTEFYGAADETRAELTLSCSLIKNKSIPFLRLEKPDSIVSIFCFRPLENAVETAIVNLMDWIITEYGLSPEEAYLFTTVNPDFRVHVYQMVRIDKINYTAGAELPKRYLPQPDKSMTSR